jgi:hypothetical protein
LGSAENTRRTSEAGLDRFGADRQRWLTFLANHREIIAALDFFTIPTVTFKLLYCFFVIEHGRRKIRHFNVTRHPTAEWVVQQLREAFPEIGPLRYIVLDRDAKFNADVLAFLKATGLQPKRTSIQSPWQNGIAERWVGGCRRELLDHVIPLNEEYLRRLVRDYVSYFHEDRIHDGLGKDTPNRRPVQKKLCPEATVLSSARLGGLHYRTLGGRQRNSHAGFSPYRSVIVGGSFGGRPARFLDCPERSKVRTTLSAYSRRKHAHLETLHAPLAHSRAVWQDPGRSPNPVLTTNRTVRTIDWRAQRAVFGT